MYTNLNPIFAIYVSEVLVNAMHFGRSPYQARIQPPANLAVVGGDSL